MPGKVKVKIVAGRNLPVMDRSSDTTDAYVEVKLGNTTFKTDVCRKSLNPQWNSEWYRFEMDDAELQDEPLQIRLMDHDTYSANDAIGKVYLDLNPLLLPSAGASTKNALSENCPASTNSLSGGNTMSGWFPVYDTMHGIRGEVNVIVKVELFSDFNKFRQSSCGVQFFNSPTIPHGYLAQIVHGMVEELVVSDDPEYQWIDKIRTPRASNEARQTLFFKLSGEVQRRIGLKVLDIGGNAVVGYLQCFDLEAECGIVVRGLGTAVSLVKIQEPSHVLPCQYPEDVIPASPLRGSPPTSKHLKGFLAPGNSRNRRSKSPQLKQPFADYKPKRLGTYSRSFSDNVPECDNVSLKVLFEQEDMRGEPISNRKKLFERLSSFPKRKLRAFQARSRNAMSSKMPYVRSKSENVASSLIRSIMDPSTFYLDRVPEGEEMVDKHSDTDSVIHPLRYDDGHLVPISSSSSDTSSSDIEYISDDSSISTSTQEYGKIELMKCKKSKLIALNNASTSFHTSVTSSKNDDEISEKDEQEIVKKITTETFTSSVHIVMSPDSESSDHNQFSSSVKFNDSPSPPKEIKTVVSTLKRQASFDVYSNLRKRSDTPPLSEMDPYMAELSSGLKKTKQFLSPQPSLDEQLKTLPITNLSFPESVRNLPSIKSGHIPNQHIITVHTIDVCDRSNSSEMLVSNSACIKPSTELNPSLEPDAIHQKSQDGDNNINTQNHTSFSLKGSPKTNDTVDKILNNPFKFPSEFHTDNLKREISEYYIPINMKCDSIDTNTSVPIYTSVELELNSTNSTSKPSKIMDDEINVEFCETSSAEKFNIIDTLKTDSDIKLTTTLTTNTDIGAQGIHDRLASSMNLLDQNKVNTTYGSEADDKSFPFNNPSVDLKDETTDENTIVGEESVSSALAIDVVESDDTNQVTCNLSPPLHPLVKSLSASGLVEPAHSSVPPSRTVPEEAAPGLQPVTKASQSPIKLPSIHRRSSDSDLSITPKGNSLTSSGDRSSVAGSTTRAFQSISAKLAMKKEPIEAMEFPFLTMNKFPAGFIVNIAGTVASRSVKLLERVSNQEEPESRDAWWTELRMEVRSHMRALSANALIGYSETTTICDDVCVLSASGTAAVVNVRAPTNPPVSDTPEPPATNLPPKHLSNMTTSLDRTEFERQGPLTQSTPLKADTGGGGGVGGGGKVRHHSESTEQPPEPVNCACSVCHLPFNPSTVPLSMTAIKCGVCGKRKVPDLLLATIEPLEGLSVIGRSCLIHVFVTRPKQHARGEMNACVVSDSLPFIEYDIYKQLVNKLKVNGMNAVFGLKTQICLGERMIAAVTSGTAMYLEALPPPSTPTITPGEAWNEDSKLTAVLKGLQETVKKNRDFYQVRTAGSTSQDTDKDNSTGGGCSDTEESDDELPDIDLHAGNKEACVFMVDDEQDIEVVSQLIDPHPPEGFFVTSTEGLPGMDELEMVRNLQMFTQIWRSRIPSSQPTSSMHKHFHKLLQGIYYKLRRMTPCAVGNIKFRLALPEPDEMQISIVGMAVGLGEGLRNVKSVRRRTVGASSKPESVKKTDDGDMIFSLEEDQEISNNQVSKNPRPKSPVRPTRQSTHLPPKERYGVDITPLSYIPGGRIERYLGNLNFFFIRETSCIREGGGLSGFVHSFVAEVLAIIRAHVTALGGNAMVAFFLNECIILNNPHKNHGQCLINVGGDAVSVSYLD